jgi:hypothetical protein
MEVIYFRLDGVEPTKIWTTSDGKIDFAALDEHFRLEPGSIKLCGDVFPQRDGKSEAPWKQIGDLLGVEGSEQSPVMVSGRPKIEAPTSMFSINNIFCHDHNHDSPKLLEFGLSFSPSSSLLFCCWAPELPCPKPHSSQTPSSPISLSSSQLSQNGRVSLIQDSKFQRFLPPSLS